MKNETRYTDDNLRLRCEISGYPVLKYTWFKDNVTLKNRDRVFIKMTPWGSRYVDFAPQYNWGMENFGILKYFI